GIETWAQNLVVAALVGSTTLQRGIGAGVELFGVDALYGDNRVCRRERHVAAAVYTCLATIIAEKVCLHADVIELPVGCRDVRRRDLAVDAIVEREFCARIGRRLLKTAE